ncbi:hypothetical protein [Gluconobacter kondonii]|nr:hypothetical protein [Gluconobacter kondonii]
MTKLFRPIQFAAGCIRELWHWPTSEHDDFNPDRDDMGHHR